MTQKKNGNEQKSIPFDLNADHSDLNMDHMDLEMDHSQIKDLETRLKDSTNNLEIPESLKPESIKMRLDVSNTSGKRQNYLYRIPPVAYKAAALFLVIGVSVLSFSLIGQQQSQKPDYKSAISSTKMVSNTDSYEDIFKKLSQHTQETNGDKAVSGNSNKAEDNAVMPELEAGVRDDVSYDYGELQSDADSETSSNHSETNTQVKGIDEGDIIKNDGTYLYALKNNSNILILKANGESVKKMSSIKIQAEEFYVNGDMLIAIHSDYGYGDYPAVYDTGVMRSEESSVGTDVVSPGIAKDSTTTPDDGVMDSDATSKTSSGAGSSASSGVSSGSTGSSDTNISSGTSSGSTDPSGGSADAKEEPSEPQADIGIAPDITKSKVTITFYDISDRSEPKKINTIHQDGYYNTSRIADGHLYTISNYYIYETMNAKEYDSYIPKVNDKLIEADSIYIPEHTQNRSFAVISSIDLENTKEVKDELAINSNCYQIYMSTNSLYISDTNYGADGLSNESLIKKISYEKGNLSVKETGKVSGSIGKAFSIDEYNGYLRVLTTGYSDTTYTNLFVLDKQMDVVGKLTKLAKNETLRSSRFLKDFGYFVTYENMDPLFAVDLSNPEKPTIISELKITGFSEYLHFYDDGLLLGIGLETDPDTNETLGLKLSMFDISDPNNIAEKDKMVLKEYTSSDALNQYKAVMIDTKNNLIGFDSYSSYLLYKTDYDSLTSSVTEPSAISSDGNVVSDYLCFSYDKKKGFVKKVTVDLNKMKLSSYADSYMANYGNRGTYIDDYLYVYNINGSLSVTKISTDELMNTYFY